MYHNFFEIPVDFFSLNVRGLSNPERLTEVCNMTKNQSHSNKKVIALQETKLSKTKEEHEKILKKFGFSYKMVPANGNSGGLMILYPSTFNVTPIVKNENMLAIDLSHNGCDTLIIANIYINPKDHKIANLEAAFAEIEQDKNIIAMGDFNAIDPFQRHLNKKPPKSNDIRILHYNKITQIFASQKMFDIGKTLSITESTHYDKRTRTSNRIDYFFGNISYQNCEMFLYTTSFSDHKCLHLAYHVLHETHGNGSWKLNDEILENKTLITSVLNRNYENYSFSVKNYDIFKSRIRDSLRLICIQNAKKKKIMEKQLMREVEVSEKHLSRKIQIELKDLREHEEKILKLKTFQQSEAQLIAKSIKNFYLDINEGDPKSTKNLVRCLKSKNEIRKIITRTGEVVTNENEILDKVAEFFQECYKENPPSKQKKCNLFLEKFFQKNEKKLKKFESEQTSLENDEENPISEFEVERAIMKLNSRSAPGADGLTSDLYKSQKEFFVPLLTKLFNDIHKTNNVPPSFELAVIKLIEKKHNVYDIGNFRPISLINTDQKVLSHVIAHRLKSVLDVLIGPHQTAHLSNRNINSSLLKLQTFATGMSKREGIIALDFNKAFDKVNRKYMMEMINRLPIDCQTKNIIEKMYENTVAIINIKGIFSKSFKTETGVRQGCPMSALMFNLAIEPPIQTIEQSKLIKSSQKVKSIAFADDISICMNLQSIGSLTGILNRFAQISGLTVNVEKCKVLTEGKTYKQEKWKFEKVSRTKILGININVKGTLDQETKSDLIQTAKKAALYVGPAVSLRARAKNIETFVMPKLIYFLRHYSKAKTLTRKLNSILINHLWLNQKHNVNQEIVNTPEKDGGVGLKNLEKCILTAKIMNLRTIAFGSKEKHFISSYKQSKAFNNLKNDMHKDEIEILELAPDKLTIQYFFKSLEIKNDTSSKQLYEFLVKSIITIPCFKNINISAMKLHMSPNIIFEFLAKLRKSRRLKSFDKNILYNFLMNAYLEKQEKWLKNIVPHPLCFACEETFETWNHLMFECPQLAQIRSALKIQTWKDILLDKTCLSAKLLVAIILSSWTGTPGKYLNFYTQKLKNNNTTYQLHTS